MGRASVPERIDNAKLHFINIGTEFLIILETLVEYEFFVPTTPSHSNAKIDSSINCCKCIIHLSSFLPDHIKLHTV